jgi:hypothetical protein
MDRAKKIFLLPCACSASIEVVAGQAGGAVDCPACGRKNAVPKLRDMAALAVKADASTVRQRTWTVAESVALGGAIVALLSWAGAAYAVWLPKAAFPVEAIRSDIERSDDQRLYQALQDFAEASVNRMPMRDEVMLHRKTQFATGVSRALAGLGGLAALAAAAAWLGGTTGRRPS